jgi:hypothetical protein
VLNGILLVLTTGIAWQRLPQELGFGSGMTAGVAAATGNRSPSPLSQVPSSRLLFESLGARA